MASGMQFYLDYNTRSVLRSLMRAFDDYYGQDVEWEKLESMNFTKYFIEEEIEAQAHALADELRQDVMMWRMNYGVSVPRYLRISSLAVEDFFKSRARAEIGNWISEYSEEYVKIMDQVNMILNAGGFTTVLDYDVLRLYRRNLRGYFEARNSLNEVIFDRLPVAVSRAYLPLSLNDADCIYEAASRSNRVLLKTFTKLVSKEKFLEYAELLLKAMDNREKIVEVIQKLYLALGDKLENIDWNPLFRNIYFDFMQERTLLMNLDFESMIDTWNWIVNYLGDAQEKIWRGEWTFLEQFLDNFLRNSMGSQKFWEELGMKIFSVS